MKMPFTFLPGSLASYRTLITVFNSQIIQSHVVPKQELYQDLFFKTVRPGYDADKIRKESLQCQTNLFGWELRLPALCFIPSYVKSPSRKEGVKRRPGEKEEVLEYVPQEHSIFPVYGRSKEKENV
jgi:hypothetical protein